MLSDDAELAAQLALTDEVPPLVLPAELEALVQVDVVRNCLGFITARSIEAREGETIREALEVIVI